MSAARDEEFVPCELVADAPSPSLEGRGQGRDSRPSLQPQIIEQPTAAIDPPQVPPCKGAVASPPPAKKAVAKARKTLGFFRWGYLAPRLAIVLALVLSVHFGLDPLLKWTLVTSGEAALGAKVEVGDLRTSLRYGTIEIEGLAAANPKKPMRNLLEAEQVYFHVDAHQLVRGRVVIRDGVIHGIQFDSPRTTSGALEEDPNADAGPSAMDPVIDAASQHASAWFDDLTGRLEQDLMAQLATPKLAQELEDRWPKQYEQLKARAEELRTKAKEIEARFREVKRNPLRNFAQVDLLQKELAATQTKLHNALTQIQDLPNQAKADRAALDAARKQDEQFLREHLKLAAADGDQLTQYLLGGEASGYLAQTSYWLDWVRRIIPKNKIAPPDRSRGVDVVLLPRKSKFLLERVELTGAARLGSQPLSLQGELTDVASEPLLHDQPTRLHLVGSGAAACDLKIEIDRRGEIAHDSLVLDCPRLSLAHRTLGKTDRLAIVVAPGEASISAKINLDGDALTGVIELRQAATLTASTPMIRDDRIAQVLHDSLRGVDRLEATVHLAGTLKRPEWKVESNVGPQLAEGVNGAARRYLTERKDQLVAKMQGKIDEQMARLDAKRAEAQQELMAKLGENQQLVTQLAALADGKLPIKSASLPQGVGSALEKLKR